MKYERLAWVGLLTFLNSFDIAVSFHFNPFRWKLAYDSATVVRHGELVLCSLQNIYVAMVRIHVSFPIGFYE